jgi:hypothetical protein
LRLAWRHEDANSVTRSDRVHLQLGLISTSAYRACAVACRMRFSGLSFQILTDQRAFDIPLISFDDRIHFAIERILVDPLDDRRVRHTKAFAHGLQPVPPAGAFQNI